MRATGTTQSPELPSSARLDQNYPNPFTSSTAITFTQAKPGNVRLTVHDMLGKRVALLDAGSRPAGEHRLVFDAKNLPTGLYHYTLTTETATRTRTMILIR